MPFTLAHPAAALPLRRKPLVLSALVIGSMAPDFEYLLHLAPRSTISHTIPGLLVFCLPTGFIVFCLFHRLWKVPVIHLLPLRHRQRLLAFSTSFPLASVMNCLSVAFSILLGATTHLVWDAFTHKYGWAVGFFPFLSAPLVKTGFLTLPLYKILQHGSSALGMTCLIVAYFRWLRRATPVPETRAAISITSRWRIVSIILLTSLASALTYAFLRATPLESQRDIMTFIGLAVVAFLAMILVEITLLGVWWQSRVERTSVLRYTE